MNLHVFAVDENTDEIRQIGRSLAELGIEVENEVLVHLERIIRPYEPVGSTDSDQQRAPANFISLTDDPEVIEMTVQTDAPLAGISLKEAGRRNLLNSEILVVTIERDGEILTPHGETEIRLDDIVTVFSRDRIDEGTMRAFLADE